MPRWSGMTGRGKTVMTLGIDTVRRDSPPQRPIKSITASALSVERTLVRG